MLRHYIAVRAEALQLKVQEASHLVLARLACLTRTVDTESLKQLNNEPWTKYGMEHAGWLAGGYVGYVWSYSGSFHEFAQTRSSTDSLMRHASLLRKRVWYLDVIPLPIPLFTPQDWNALSDSEQNALQEIFLLDGHTHKVRAGTVSRDGHRTLSQKEDESLHCIG